MPRSRLICALYALPAAAATAFLLVVFYPGNANVDIVFQAKQALGWIPYQNWHSPVMTFAWELLYRLTGTLGALYILQAVLYGLAGWLLCVLIYRHTGSAWLGLLGLTVIAAPWTLSQANMLWKDTQSALALFVGLLLVFFIRPHRPVTWWWMIPAGLLLVYGIDARKNAIAALLPIAVCLGILLVRTLRRRPHPAPEATGTELPVSSGAVSSGAVVPREGASGAVTPGAVEPAVRTRPRSWWRSALSCATASAVAFGVIAGAAVLTERGVEAARGVEDVGQISQIMLDDVMFALPDNALRSSGAPPELIEKIASARQTCLKNDEPYDAYWNCYGKGAAGTVFSPIAHRAEVKDLWITTLTEHPGRYLQYRFEQFGRYLSLSRLLYWPREWRGEAETVGLGVPESTGDELAGYYVRGVNKVLPIVYLPWFWLAAGTAVSAWGLIGWWRDQRTAGLMGGVPGRSRRGSRGGSRKGSSPGVRGVPVAVPLRAEALTLSSSAVVYMLAYIPTIPEFHFRYTYWPAIAVTAAVVFTVAGELAARRGAGLSAGGA